ncbi:MFS transporter, partial [Escherichia coli]|uniref:MFS transporter n=2 Tax=Escherichia coli TaxID=562 RepID=UPI002078EFF9
NARNGGKNSLNRLIRCVCGKKIGPDPRNFNQRVSLGRNDLLIRTFLNSGIDVDKSILMTAVIMIGAPVGIFIAALIIDHFPRRLFGSTLLIIIAVLGYIYSIQTTEWAILIYGLVMIFFLYMYVCFASAVYIPELWPTHLRLRGSGFVNAVGRIVAVFTPYGVAALLTHYGSITVFIVLGVMLLLCALVLSIFGIETRKVSLEEISEVN